MKKTFIAIFSVFLLNSCSDSFLDLPSETSLSTATFYKTEADFQQGVNAAYAPLRSVYNGTAGINISGAWAMGEMHADNTYFIHNPNYRALVDGEAIANFTVQAANTITTAKYVADYQVIARANQVLAPIDGVTFGTESKNNIKGQAFFLRALSYFDLVQYFGKVPLHLTPVTDRNGAALPLAEVEAIYTQIIQDATQAASLLPAKSKQEAGRATSGAAKTLLANVYAVQKKWALAESTLKEIIDSGEYSLLSDYASVFSVSNKNNAESVFEVQFKESTEGYASRFIYDFLPQPITAAQVTSITGAASAQARTEEAMNIPTPDLINAYETGDKRKGASIASIQLDGVTYPYIKKLLQPHAQFNITGTNWPVYRYAEVLLLYAEALNENGKTNQATTYINLVRNRAGLNNTTASTQAAIRTAILAERRVELAFENKRWLDLVRTGNAETTMLAHGAKIKANPSNYYYPSGVTPVPAAFTNISLTFPLPASESLLSPYF